MIGFIGSLSESAFEIITVDKLGYFKTLSFPTFLSNQDQMSIKLTITLMKIQVRIQRGNQLLCKRSKSICLKKST